VFVVLASVRNRLFVVIAGMALLASLAIGAAYVATETERLDLRSDATSVADLFDLTMQLSNAIRDQESAIDDYLLSTSADATARYSAAVESELRVSERIRLEAGEYPEAVTTLDALAKKTSTWRTSFARPAIAAVDHGSAADRTRIATTVGSDQEPTLTGVEAFTARLVEAQAVIAAREDELTRTRAASGMIGLTLMLLAAAASLILVRRWVVSPLSRLLATARDVEAGEDAAFVADRDDEIGRLSDALERMRVALQNDAERSTVLNRFTEATTFAVDDTEVAATSLEALRILVNPDAAVTHVLNRSKDRAVPEAMIGEAIGEVLALNALSRCPGIARGSIYVTPDATAPLRVHCPIYPIDHGTLACVPLSHGETVGAVHLFWDEPDAFPLDLRASVARVAEHAALAIGNRRLLAALQGMASTDARTGLANTRAFDQALEDALAARREDESISVLMLDLDHFKDFNDRYGHPAGDEALRAFADILRSCLRDNDLAARYGGEEFAVILPGVDAATAHAVAERIRSRTEVTLISLAPGITDRITVSIGIASAQEHARDRVSLLRLADEALYSAKESGRNRVESVSLGEGAGARADATGARKPTPASKPTPAKRQGSVHRGSSVTKAAS
jgi:diguanylate cyclase (GGDEF)-like protein